MSKHFDVDILLINPGNQKQIYQSLAGNMAAAENPVWAGLMATFARQHGLSVEILDASAEWLSYDQTAERVKAINPLLAVVVVYAHQPSASTQVMAGASEVSTAIKALEPGRTVLMVGGHVAALPERTLREEKTDYVASGEGLFTIVELAAALKAGTSNLSKVRDLWYREDGRIQCNAPAPLLQDLNTELPGIAWDLLPMQRYRAHNWHCFDGLQRQPYASLYTTLGCPYHCSFCCIQSPFKSGEGVVGIKDSVNSYRMWSPEAVISQIEILVTKYGVRNIKIADEMFVLNPRHVLNICDLIIERGYDLNIWAYTRVDTVKDNMLDKLKRAGFNWLAFGIEAASARVRDDVQKGFDQDDVFRVVKKVQDAGINVIGNYIFGLPEDDHETMQATLDMACDLNCEFANFYCAMAYPGSQLYESALKENWALPETWSGYSQHSVDCLPLRTKYLTAGEVLRFRDNAFQTYFNGQRFLDMIGQKFGPETVEHVHEMTSVRLERQNA